MLSAYKSTVTAMFQGLINLQYKRKRKLPNSFFWACCNLNHVDDTSISSFVGQGWASDLGGDLLWANKSFSWVPRSSVTTQFIYPSSDGGKEGGYRMIHPGVFLSWGGEKKGGYRMLQPSIFLSWWGKRRKYMMIQHAISFSWWGKGEGNRMIQAIKSLSRCGERRIQNDTGQ